MLWFLATIQSCIQSCSEGWQGVSQYYLKLISQKLYHNRHYLFCSWFLCSGLSSVYLTIYALYTLLEVNKNMVILPLIWIYSCWKLMHNSCVVKLNYKSEIKWKCMLEWQSVTMETTILSVIYQQVHFLLGRHTLHQSPSLLGCNDFLFSHRTSVA